MNEKDQHGIPIAERIELVRLNEENEALIALRRHRIALKDARERNEKLRTLFGLAPGATIKDIKPEE